MTTYAITRGVWLLDPKSFSPSKYLYAATLDGMERFGTPAAINEEGIRFGKGHGFFDTVADVIFTPTRTIEVRDPHKPTCGIVWDLLDPRMFETIPPLQELKAMEPGLPPLATTA